MTDPWYLTALDWRTGETVYRALAGRGPLYNNNYAPVTIGPDGTAYVGVLQGIVALRGPVRLGGAARAQVPAPPVTDPRVTSARPAPKVRARCRKGRRLRLKVR